MPKLISASGHSLELPGTPFRVGTDPTVEVPMQTGLGIADHHFTVSRAGEEFVVEDSGSGLGTFINGNPVQRGILRSGDQLRFGRIDLKFDAELSSPPVEGETEETDGSATEAPPEGAASDASSPGDGETVGAVDSPSNLVSREELALPSPSPVDQSTLKTQPEAPAKTSEPSKAKAHTKAKTQTKSLAAKGRSSTTKRSSSRRLRRLSEPSAEQKRRQAKKKRLTVVLTVFVVLGMMAGVVSLALMPAKDESVGIVLRKAMESTDSQRRIPLKNLFQSSMEKLAGIATPAAAMILDLDAVRAHEFDESLPRLKAWCYRYLKLDLADIKYVMAVGSSSSEFVLGMVLTTPVDDERMSQTEEDLQFETLRGPFAARLLSSRLLAVAPPGVLGSREEPKPPVSSLPEALAYRLKNASGCLTSFFDASKMDLGNPPFFVSDPGSAMTRKVAVMDFEESRLSVTAKFTNVMEARLYSNRFQSAMRMGLAKLLPDEQVLIEGAVSDILASSTQEAEARIRWKLDESDLAVTRALVEMIADPLGAEVAPPPLAELRQEAQRVAALYHTADKAHWR